MIVVGTLHPILQLGQVMLGKTALQDLKKFECGDHGGETFPSKRFKPTEEHKVTQTIGHNNHCLRSDPPLPISVTKLSLNYEVDGGDSQVPVWMV